MDAINEFMWVLFANACFISLTTASLLKPLTIMDQYGVVMSSTSCNDTHDIPIIKIKGVQSFICEATSTMLKPSITCWCDGSILSRNVHVPRSNLKEMDQNVFNVRREIDVTWDQCQLLKCSAVTPSLVYGAFQNSTVCLKLQQAEAEYGITCSMQNGELGSFSQFKCSVSPNNATVLKVTWYNGKYFLPVFNAYPDGDPNDGPTGRFAGRNVTGSFDRKNTTHTIKIYNSTVEDEAPYTSEFIIKESQTKRGQIFLKLVVQPKVSPAIVNANNTVVSISTCENRTSIPSIKVKHQFSLFCIVDFARPRPKTDWVYGGFARTYKETWYNRSETPGFLIYRVKRRIDIKEDTIDDGSVLQCDLEIPDPKTGHLKQANVCLRLFRVSHLPGWKIAVIVSGILLLFLVGIISLSVFLKRRYCTNAPPSGSSSKELVNKDSPTLSQNIEYDPEQPAEQENVDRRHEPAESTVEQHHGKVPSAVQTTTV